MVYAPGLSNNVIGFSSVMFSLSPPPNTAGSYSYCHCSVPFASFSGSVYEPVYSTSSSVVTHSPTV